jgi:hypothetical protein
MKTFLVFFASSPNTHTTEGAPETSAEVTTFEIRVKRFRV